MTTRHGVVADVINFFIYIAICVAAINYHAWKVATSWLYRRSSTIRTNDQRKRLVVITGCDRGFGRMLAEKLLASTNLIVLALTLTKEAAEELNTLANSSAYQKGCLIACKCDVTSDGDVVKMKQEAERILEQNNAMLYALVNNAGIADPGDFVWFQDLAVFRRVMEVNFFGCLRVTNSLLPLMLRTSRAAGARILNLSSVCAVLRIPSNSSYNAGKCALEGWCDTIRNELYHFNIKVVMLRPGLACTNIHSDWVKNFIKNYATEAPAQIRDLYGGDEFHDRAVGKFCEPMSGVAKPMGSPPTIAVNALYEMLTIDHEKLKPCYFTGRDSMLFRALNALPTSIADTVCRALFYLPPLTPKLPPADIISHVTILVRDIHKSLPFYQAFGFETFGPKQNGMQFLRHVAHASKTSWSTLFLLQEDNSLQRGAASDAGMVRLCMCTFDIQRDMKRLESVGLKHVAPVATSASEFVVAYLDPDGFMVYLVQFRGVTGNIIKANMWWNKNNTSYLIPLHWALNITNPKTVLPMLDKFGFKKVFDMDCSAMELEILAAYGIDPKTSKVGALRLCQLPNDPFMVIATEFITPKAEKRGAELLNSMTISVGNVEEALALAKAAEMKTEATVSFKYFPVFGKVPVGVAYAEPGSCPIEFCCFTESR